LNKDLLNTVIQNFINNNFDNDIAALLLKGNLFDNVDNKEVVEQIEAKKRCKDKLQTWFDASQIYYPNKLNIEQTSSEATAKYKVNLISGESIIDLTGGFGIDCFYFSKTFEKVTHCEIDTKLSRIVNHNYNQLGVSNIETINGNGLEHLSNLDKKYDWIYIDPSRRHNSKGKVFYLKDCLPNVPEHLNLLFEHSDNILIKASPMLDISVGLSELDFVKEIHVVAINNDVKELLFFLEKGFNGNVMVKTANIKNAATESFNFIYTNEQLTEAEIDYPDNYLYEPNTAILKAGAFKSMSNTLNIKKLHQHSHLYTSKDIIEFPGRIFKIIEVLQYNKKLMTKRFGKSKMNITIRNFPESVNKIRGKFKIKDGGNLYAFFTTNCDDEKIVILCEKV
jgi:hypothetical protein